jgi:hypothetical protein
MRDVETAAEAVHRAMRALDARRHETAPTLEHEYRRALEAYFAAAEQAAGRVGAGEFDDDATGAGASASEEEAVAALEEEARAADLRGDLASIAGHYAAARRALRLARAYLGEPGSSGRRERECVAAALRHRQAIRAIRLRMQPPAEQLLLPGLAKTRPSADVGRLTRTA